MSGGYWKKKCCRKSSSSSESSSSSSEFKLGGLCLNCLDGNAPKQYQADVSNIVNGSCLACSPLNGSYILDQQLGNPCLWRATFSSVCAHFVTIQIHIYQGLVGGISRKVVEGVFFNVVNPFGSSINYLEHFPVEASQRPDCIRFNSFNLPFSGHSGPILCNGTAGIFNITALN